MQVAEPVCRNYARPPLKQLLQQTIRTLLRRFNHRTHSSGSADRSHSVPPDPRFYDKPVVRKLTLEQARLIALGHSTLHDPGAQDLMLLLFPEEPVTTTAS